MQDTQLEREGAPTVSFCIQTLRASFQGANGTNIFQKLALSCRLTSLSLRALQ